MNVVSRTTMALSTPGDIRVCLPGCSAERQVSGRADVDEPRNLPDLVRISAGWAIWPGDSESTLINLLIGLLSNRRGETADFQRWTATRGAICRVTRAALVANSAGAVTGPTSWCSRDHLGRPASSRLQLSSLATVSGVDRVTERPAAPLTTRVRALARLRRTSGAHQPQKAAPRLPSFPSRHR